MSTRRMHLIVWLLLGLLAQGAADTPTYVSKHWKGLFRETEKEIQRTTALYKRGRDPYEGLSILDRQFCILPSDRTPRRWVFPWSLSTPNGLRPTKRLPRP